MSHSIPHGITPPTPNQDKEEPDLWHEDDIPSSGESDEASHQSDQTRQE